MTSHEKNKLEAMAEEIEEIKGDMAEVKDILRDIHTLLKGNPSFPNQKGLVEDYNDTKDKVNTLESELKKYKSYFYALVTLVGAGIIKFVTDLLGK